MKIPRIAAAVAVTAVALTALSGCFQLPNLTPTDPGTTDPGTTDPGTDPGTTDPGTEPTEDLSTALVDTHWTGRAENPATNTGIDLGFTLESDGTLLIDTWNDATDVPYDDATDTWSVSGDQITVHLSNIQNIQSIDFTGTATETGPIQLTGTDGNGDTGYTMTMTLG